MIRVLLSRAKEQNIKVAQAALLNRLGSLRSWLQALSGQHHRHSFRAAVLIGPCEPPSPPRQSEQIAPTIGDIPTDAILRGFIWMLTLVIDHRH